MNQKQIRTVTIGVAIGTAHVALVAGAFLVQGCGTTRGPGAAHEEVTLPPRAIPQTPPRLDPITPSPSLPEVETIPDRTIPPPPAPSASGETYTIARGDTLSGIAVRFGTTTAVLMTLNNISDPDRIIVGQKLVLPEGSDPSAPERPSTAQPRVEGAGTYTVKPGDSLSVIAVRSGVRVADLKQVNNLTTDVIRVGQKLVIPSGGQVPEQAEPAPATPRERPDPEFDLSVDPVLPEPGPVVQPREPTVQQPGPAERQPEDRPQSQRYIVQPGDSLLSVSSQWSVSIVDLKRANDLADGPLTPGQELRIPVID